MAGVDFYADARFYFFHPLCCGKKINKIAELLLLLSIAGVARFFLKTTTLLFHPHEWWWSSYVRAQDNKGCCVLH
jgi:hypothetical protein